MTALAPCQGCSWGMHENHVHMWDPRREDPYDGTSCPCMGGCKPTPENQKWLNALDDVE